MICPKCGSGAIELVVCENCETIGCARCIIASGKKWLCEKCRNPEEHSSENALMRMFD